MSAQSPRCSKCQQRSVLDPCLRCANSHQAADYPPKPNDDETWLELNRRLWKESGPRPQRVGSRDVEVIHQWAEKNGRR